MENKERNLHGQTLEGSSSYEVDRRSFAGDEPNRSSAEMQQNPQFSPSREDVDVEME
ncbi:hypothetical protein LINGRAHAP2_LOCUS30955 [Linum grandiflorum]